MEKKNIQLFFEYIDKDEDEECFIYDIKYPFIYI